ncbi:tetratricopeptide repeat protein [Maribacter sp. MAR_2009_72]|uniref:tetratricopeptide repeat protein n=1 Tax=Maribacter sp. MAR_2009_72 TaxID=1250050 RepID=UPI00119C714F|nr:tetratricopeptide repeat protein [Maribacter sp. MAR_2009_72]TVZ15934.1 TPR repeat protein [Maribacter sp. MAR_2009_72]
MNKIRIITLSVFVSLSANCIAQEMNEQEKEKALKTSTNLTWEGNKSLSEDDFIAAEVNYRKAISESPENSAAPYNLGNAYYLNETYNEAFSRFKEAGETSTSKKDKHSAYHNMGNVFMKRKEYEKAVEAYKEALRNDPTDEETRYNLALAKELLKKDEENKQQNQDDKDEDKKDKDENKDQDKKDEGENEDKKDQGDEGDKGEEGDKNEEQKDENKDGERDKKNQKKQPEQGDKEQQQQPRPNQLSKQQVENLLRAMQNAEKKVQDKIDAKKVKGVKIKNEKDW